MTRQVANFAPATSLMLPVVVLSCLILRPSSKGKAVTKTQQTCLTAPAIITRLVGRSSSVHTGSWIKKSHMNKYGVLQYFSIIRINKSRGRDSVNYQSWRESADRTSFLKNLCSCIKFWLESGPTAENPLITIFGPCTGRTGPRVVRRVLHLLKVWNISSLIWELCRKKR